jgi:hypothetical protein
MRAWPVGWVELFAKPIVGGAIGSARDGFRKGSTHPTKLALGARVGYDFAQKNTNAEKGELT